MRARTFRMGKMDEHYLLRSHWMGAGNELTMDRTRRKCTCLSRPTEQITDETRDQGKE